MKGELALELDEINLSLADVDLIADRSPVLVVEGGEGGGV